MDGMGYSKKQIALLKAAAIIGSQAELARQLGIKPDRLNHWVNWDMPIPFEFIEVIEALTGGKVTREQLGPHIDWRKHPRRASFTPKADDQVVEVALIRLIVQHKPIGAETVSALAKHIATEGLQLPIIIDINGRIIDGHQRVRAYEQLNLKSIPCKVIDIQQLITHAKPLIGLLLILDLREQATLYRYLKLRFRQRQGQAKVDNDSPFQGKKSRDVAAMLMGYGSWRVPEQLEKVLILGVPELLDAIAAKHIAPANAVLLLSLSTRWQQQILTWPKVTIIRFCKRLRQKKQTTLVYPQLE